MKLELLLVRDCPNAGAAESAFAEAARMAGVSTVELVRTIVETPAQANAWGFVGSPTFAVDGEDLFAAPGSECGVTCRVYSTLAGLSGVPEATALRDALLRVCASRASAAADRSEDAGASGAG